MAHFKVAAVLFTVAIVSGEYSSSAVQKAEEWLRNHQDPGDQAGLAELKAKNPDAYAVVNALLTKRSLGLLNSRHPMAPMGSTDGADAPNMNGLYSTQVEPKTTADASTNSPQVDPKAEVVAPDVDVQVSAAPRHHDFLNWKPASDDQMVSNVLGMVAGLTSGRAPVDPQPAAASATGSVQAPPVDDEESHPQSQVSPQTQQRPQSIQSLDWGNTYAGFQAKHDAAQTVSALPAMQVPAQQAELSAPDVDVQSSAAPRPHDFLNWKPSNDEQMVSNVLGMVAGLKRGSAPQGSEVVSSMDNVQEPAVKDVAPLKTQPEIHVQPEAQNPQQPQHHASVLSFDWGNTYAGFQPTRNDAKIASSPKTNAQAQKDLSNNPYLKGIDFSSDLPPSTMSQVAENSYLKSVNNFNGEDAPKPKAEITAKDIGGPNKLTAFNWYTN